MNIGYKLRIFFSKPLFKIISKPSPTTFIGENKIKEVAKILHNENCRNVLIITDNNIVSLGIAAPMLKELESFNIKYSIYSDVTPDPTFEVVDYALNAYSNYDSVIAVGGGSVIDTAKVVSASKANNIEPEKLKGIFKVKKKPLPFICIPTTSGTGSETTIAAVISDTKSHEKVLIIDPKLVADYAILDPLVTTGLPRSITVFTTMDALTHALEAYVSTYATDESNRLSERAIKIIYKYLRITYSDPKNIEAREQLLLASYYAGMAFSKTYVGYVHAFSHSIGGKFGVSHGLGNAVILPHVMEFYLDACEDKFAKLYDLVGLKAGNLSSKEKASGFVQSIFNLNREFSVPERIEDFSSSSIQEITKSSFSEAHGTYPVPKYMSYNQANTLLKKVCAK